MFPLKKHQSTTPSVESIAVAKPVVSVESASLVDYADSLKERFGVHVFRQQLSTGLETQQLDNSEREAMMDRIKSTINDYDNKHPHTGPAHIYLLDGRGMGNADDAVVDALITSSLRNPSQTLAALIPENVNYSKPDDLSPASMLRQLADRVLASEGVRCVVGKKALESFLAGDEQYVIHGEAPSPSLEATEAAREALENELAKKAERFFHSVDSRWKKGYLRFNREGAASGFKASYSTGDETHIVDVTKHNPGELRREFEGLLRSKGKHDAVALLTLDAKKGHDVKFNFDNPKWADISKMDGKDGTPSTEAHRDTDHSETERRVEDKDFGPLVLHSYKGKPLRWESAEKVAAPWWHGKYSASVKYVIELHGNTEISEEQRKAFRDFKNHVAAVIREGLSELSESVLESTNRNLSHGQLIDKLTPERVIFLHPHSIDLPSDKPCIWLLDFEQDIDPDHGVAFGMGPKGPVGEVTTADYDF